MPVPLGLLFCVLSLKPVQFALQTTKKIIHIMEEAQHAGCSGDTRIS
jgi:hypothetical protein